MALDVDGKKVCNDERLFCYIKALFSTLVLVPGHPELGPFYIIKGLMNAVPRYGWQTNPSNGMIIRVYIEMLGLLASLSQVKFPYSIEGVESNDTLYGGGKLV